MPGAAQGGEGRQTGNNFADNKNNNNKKRIFGEPGRRTQRI